MGVFSFVRQMLGDEPNSENGLGKRETTGDESLFGVFGTLEDKEPLCIHDLPGGKGCYCCDPNQPYRLKQEGRA